MLYYEVVMVYVIKPHLNIIIYVMIFY